MGALVQLSDEEMRECVRRAMEAIENGRKCKNDFTMGNADAQFDFKKYAAGAEIILGRLLGIDVYALNFETRDEGDVGGVECRSSHEYQDGMLRVNERDVEKGKLDRPFAAVVHRHKVRRGLYEVVGWHYGWYVRAFGEEKQSRKPNPRGQVITQKFWMLPVSKQLPVDELICIARGLPPEQVIRKWNEIEYFKKKHQGE